MPTFDIIFVLPYLFSDHPSFPEGILKRALESKGFSVGIIDRPFWQKPESFKVLGRPKLFFAIISGPVDSTVLNYTSSRKRRMEDQYQEGGIGFFPDYPPSIKYKIRPDNTVILFANKIRENFKNIPIVIGGTEATLRQFAHYDFQKDKIRRSILFDSRADILVTGPGEKQIINIAEKVRDGGQIKELNLNGTSVIIKDISGINNRVVLPSLDDILNDKKKLLEAYMVKDNGMKSGKVICQKNGDRYIVNFPTEIYTGKELDRFYSFGYKRTHLETGKYSPALRMNLFSVTSHRGCGGGCSFCSISLNEGKKIISRSVESIHKEINGLKKHKSWKGVISDIGGPSAEMFGYGCDVPLCIKNACLFPEKCLSLKTGSDYLNLLRSVRKMNGIKKIFIGSGVRYDSLVENEELLEEILVHHSGKYLRIAPEHTENHILNLIRKPGFDKLSEFMSLFSRLNRKMKRKISASPYLIIGHPGETFEDVKTMKKKLISLGLKTTDAQIFTPTPGTLSTAMFYSGIDPDGKPLHVEKDIKELIKRKRFLNT